MTGRLREPRIVRRYTSPSSGVVITNAVRADFAADADAAMVGRGWVRHVHVNWSPVRDARLFRLDEHGAPTGEWMPVAVNRIRVDRQQAGS